MNPDARFRGAPRDTERSTVAVLLDDCRAARGPATALAAKSERAILENMMLCTRRNHDLAHML